MLDNVPCQVFKNHVLPYWKSIVVVGVPLLFLPLPISGTAEGSVGYVMVIMAAYWMTEAVPLAVTAMIPVMALPLLGVMNTGQVCGNYFNEANMMFMGGLIIGISVEYCNLHLRIALRVVLAVGTDMRWLMLGVMMVTMFLSMWVSNPAATAMIIPIVEVLIEELFREPKMTAEGSQQCLTPANGDKDGDSESDTFAQKRKKRLRHIRVNFLLAVAYSANVGGTGTMIGSTPQLALKGIVEEIYGSDTGLSFSSWMAINMPIAFVITILLWLWFIGYMFGFKCQKPQTNANEDQEEQVTKLVKQKYQDLGPMTFHEWTVLILFIILVNLWLWKDPKFVAGWGYLFSKKIGDTVPVVATILVLFSMPITPNFWCWRKDDQPGSKPKANKAMLDWPMIRDKLPWGLFLVMGSGFALSDASRVSGLSKWLGQRLAVLEMLPTFAILIVTCFIISWMTEVVSNTTTANITLPVLAQMAEAIKVNPLYFMIPAATTCCYTYVLPVGTPPNAMVYEAAKMSPVDMLKVGVVAKMLSVVVMCIFTETLGRWILYDDYTAPMSIVEAVNATILSST